MRTCSVNVASSTNAEKTMIPLASERAEPRMQQDRQNADQNPSTPLPTSPMNTRARGKLNGRKPQRPPQHRSSARRLASASAQKSAAMAKRDTKSACSASNPSDAIHEVVQVDRPDQREAKPSSARDCMRGPAAAAASAQASARQNQDRLRKQCAATRTAPPALMIVDPSRRRRPSPRSQEEAGRREMAAVPTARQPRTRPTRSR